MNAFLDLDEIAARVRSNAPSSYKVGTGYDRDYLEEFGKSYPQIWVGAQRLLRIDDGRGYSGRVRQRCTVEVALRLVSQRYADGQVSGAPALRALCNLTASALIGWAPAGADEALAWSSASDGPSTETFLTADLIVSTTATYIKDIAQ